MENKYKTLYTIFELVKNDTNPTLSTVRPVEVIARLNFPWDEIGDHLKELQSDGLLNMKQLSTAVISITDKGIAQVISSGTYSVA
jgi:predicted transcriptional regulator